MALMTEERRKEMEEEMSRFELEILAPGGGRGKAAHSAVGLKDKPLSPPPPPPSAVTSRLPEVAVLAKAPPPPPPSHSPPHQTALRPPPPPPMISSQPTPSVQFIPHQLHRQPNRPQMRPNFMGMRGPMPGPPQPFHPQNNYGPPMGMGGPHMQQHHMHPGPHHMHGMPMHHPMNMGVSLPMPPGFCPPGPGMGHNMGYDQQYGHEGNNGEPEVPATENEGSSENPPVVESAPTIYAAPFVKNPADVSSEASSGSGALESSTSVTPVSQKQERATFGKSTQQSSTVGPVMPTGNEDSIVSKKREKKKKIVRMAGGQAWEDNSLLEWESDDFRIFCGDLGNDVTDEVLIRAFSKYTSFIKAKVIRDKRTNKTKGFGFVSFKDPQDFIKAMREMNGRYVGSRPIKLRKSTWRDRNIDIVKKKQREKEKLGMM